MSEKVDNIVQTVTGFAALTLIIFCVIFTEVVLITGAMNGTQDKPNTTQVSEVQRTN